MTAGVMSNLQSPSPSCSLEITPTLEKRFLYQLKNRFINSVGNVLLNVLLYEYLCVCRTIPSEGVLIVMKLEAYRGFILICASEGQLVLYTTYKHMNHHFSLIPSPEFIGKSQNGGP